jgi:hypothetical protein
MLPRIGSNALEAILGAIAVGLMLSMGADSSLSASADPTPVYSVLKGAPQLIYQVGVPHTDRNGRMQPRLDAASFFPRCAYEALPDMLADLRAAGFNCFKPWNGLSLDAVLPDANRAGLQVLREMLVGACEHREHPECNPDANAESQIMALVKAVAPHASDPSLLAWYIEEEPTACINLPSSCPERLANYRRLQTALKAVDPVHPSFILDISVPYASALAEWNHWNSAGDVTGNDNYPFTKSEVMTLESSVDDYSRLVRLNHQQKPVWITVQAFHGAAGNFSWTMPTPAQLRAEVFAAVVHGATGIIYFALDSWASRSAWVIGIASSALDVYPNHNPGDSVATPADIAASAALWGETVQLNQELQRLQSAILSPTSKLPYTVAIAGRGVSPTPVRALLKEVAGQFTLLLINIDNVPLKIRIGLPRAPVELQSIDRDGAASALTADSNEFHDAIEGFGVRIYTFQ